MTVGWEAGSKYPIFRKVILGGEGRTQSERDRERVEIVFSPSRNIARSATFDVRRISQRSHILFTV